MTSENSSQSPAGNILGVSPQGFSTSLQHQALSIAQRIQSGENIPLDELKAFILAGDSDLTKTAKVRNGKEKATDVDFF